MSDENINDMMLEFCKAGADSVRCYTDVSGVDHLDPPYMPEYFMSSFIFQKLGRTRSVTLETNLANLVKWNNDTREKRQLQNINEHTALNLIAELRRPRVDMVLFGGPSSPEKNLFAVVEFKNGEISISDREKLLKILPLLDTCPYGIVCGWIEDTWLDSYKSMLPSDDKLFVERVPGEFGKDRKFLFGALVLYNPAYARDKKVK